jgi:hypothetical protein
MELMPHGRRAPSDYKNSKGYGHGSRLPAAGRNTPACRNAALRRAGTDTLFSNLRMESEIFDRLSLFLRLSNLADDKRLFAEVIQS